MMLSARAATATAAGGGRCRRGAVPLFRTYVAFNFPPAHRLSAKGAAAAPPRDAATHERVATTSSNVARPPSRRSPDRARFSSAPAAGCGSGISGVPETAASTTKSFGGVEAAVAPAATAGVDERSSLAAVASEAIRIASSAARRSRRSSPSSAAGVGGGPVPSSSGDDRPAVDGKSMREASDAAAALLSLASRPAIEAALRLRLREDRRDAGAKKSDDQPTTTGGGCGAAGRREAARALHRAFLAVASWCVSVVESSSSLPTASSSRTASAAPSSSRSEEERLLRMRRYELIRIASELAHRSEHLGLPLHVPLYRRLASSVARCDAPPLSGDSDYPSSSKRASGTLLLDLFDSMVRAHSIDIAMLSGDGSAADDDNDSVVRSFFADPLVALAKRFDLRELLLVMKTLEMRHGLTVEDVLDYDSGMAILGSVKDVVDANFRRLRRSEEEGRATPDGGEEGGEARPPSPERIVDEADASELVDLLRRPLLRWAGRGLSTGGGIPPAAMDDSAVAASFDWDDPDEEELFDDETDENDDGVLGELASSVAERLADDDPDGAADALEVAAAAAFLEGDASASAASLSKYASEADADRAICNLDPSRMPAERRKNEDGADDERDTTDDDDDDDAAGAASEVVYVRDGPTWSLPDVTEQLASWNEGRPVKFTKEYEESLLRAWEDETDMEDYDDSDEDQDGA